MKKIVLGLAIMLLTGSAVFAAPSQDVEVPKPVMHRRPQFPVGVIPTKHPRVFVGAKNDPYYHADCKKPMGYYDPYYCGTNYAPGVVRFSLPRAGVTFAF